MTLLKITDLTLAIKRKPILKNISFSLSKGDVCVLLGRNGAGKSTLLKAILGLYHRQEGAIQLNTLDVANGSRKEFLLHVGAMIESASLYEHLSAWQNLDLIRRYYGINKERIDEVLEIIGLSNQKDKRIEYFSTGMKQRLGIGIAILHNPELILLDEPTSTLDIEGKEEVVSLIQKLNKQFSTTFLISTHDLADAKLYSNRYIILKEGSLAFDTHFHTEEEQLEQRQTNIEDHFKMVHQ